MDRSSGSAALPMRPPLVVTAVVGAGPAGLLFSIASRLVWARGEGDPEAWSIVLFDKRSEYQRTHRLRIAPEPVRALQLELADPRFDAIVDHLDRWRFMPTVNDLEAQLAGLATDLGVTKQLLEVGTGGGRIPVTALRDHLLGLGLLPAGALLTIVGADSVHSEVREAVRGDLAVVEHTHQTVARLRVIGDALPDRLGRLDTYRVSKVLGSVVDYRHNPNGFAEVDLFLDGPEHERLGGLGATPAAPVLLDEETADGVGSPVFARLVRHLRSGLSDTESTVALQSTFRLEHRYLERLGHRLPDGTPVFLVGDAAVSLPFFRGMACLVACAHRLALVHAELARGGDPDQIGAAVDRYDRESTAIRDREVDTVRARARLIRGAREFARVSALLPFPLQTWFLSIPDRRTAARTSAGTVLGALLAAVAAGCVLGAMAFEVEGAVPGSLWWTGLAAEAIGGLAYRASLEFEPGSDARLRAVWRLQIASVLVAGVVVAVARWGTLSAFLTVVALTSWFLLGLAFLAGVTAYEAIGRRLEAGAHLDDG